MRGSIVKRGGTYAIVVEQPRGPGRKRRPKWLRGGRTRKEAEQKLAAALHAMANGGLIETTRLTFAAYVEKWLLFVKNRVRQSTLARYTGLLKDHATPAVGALPLSEVRPLHLQELYARLLESGRKKRRATDPNGLSARSVLHLHRVLFAAFKQAVRWRMLAVNPCNAVEPPRASHVEQRALDGHEVARLFAAASNTRLSTFVVMAVSTGARRGELLALKWPGIDFDRKTAAIDGSLQRDGSITEPKTQKSRRTIVLPEVTIEALRTHRARQNSQRLKIGGSYQGEFVFADDVGRSWNPNGLGTLFRRIARTAALGSLRIHDLRHTAASLWLSAGVPMATVAATLGHSSVTTTMSIYAHHLKTCEESAAIAMDAILPKVLLNGGGM